VMAGRIRRPARIGPEVVLAAALTLAPAGTLAQDAFATRTLRAGTVLTAADLHAEGAGAEARIAARDVTAADIAEETRVELLSSQGDVNLTEARRAAVADVAAPSD